jgi:APA family basic amino acid/polyamine antiporter
VASKYEQILNYVVSVDVIFFALSAVCVFIFRRRRASTPGVFRVPGHPFTTLFFIAACAVITFSLLYKFPLNSGISFGIMLLGVPAYFLWAVRVQKRER